MFTLAEVSPGVPQNLWGTPIFAAMDTQAAQVNAPLAAYLRKLAVAESPEVRSNRNGAWQSRNKRFLDPDSHPSASKAIRKLVRRLRDRVQAALRRYLDEQLQSGGDNQELPQFETAIEASWANVLPTNGMNGPHVHPFAAMSGAYYVDCGGDGNVSASSPSCQISLMDPRPSAPMAHLPAAVRDALDFGIDWNITVWPGMFVIFPAWLNHWVAPNTAANSRISISFNAGVRLVDPVPTMDAKDDDDLDR